MSLKFYETRCPECRRLSSVSVKDEPCEPLIYCGECAIERIKLVRLEYKEPQSLIWR